MICIISNSAQKVKFIIFRAHYFKMAQHVTALYTYIPLLYAHTEGTAKPDKLRIFWPLTQEVNSILEKTASKLLIYMFTAIGLTPGGSSTVHIYTQTIHTTTQWNRIYSTYITIIHKHNNKNTQFTKLNKSIKTYLINNYKKWNQKNMKKIW
jgi:hypothetical protein